MNILVPRGRAPFGQHQESRPLAWYNTWSHTYIHTYNLLKLPSQGFSVRDSRTSRHSAHAQSQVWQIGLVLVSIYCVFKAIQNQTVVGPGQRSRFLVLTKRSAASGDENELWTVPCIRLARGKFELTNQHSAGWKILVSWRQVNKSGKALKSSLFSHWKWHYICTKRDLQFQKPY